jgi:4,5-DOPA dioxygenase extradiol
MKRRHFLGALASLPLASTTLSLRDLERIVGDAPVTERMPALFIGHGHPINAVLDNDFTRTIASVGRELPAPRAIMVVSAHWMTTGTYVSVNPHPHALYDFGRLDERLYHVQYAPPGAPAIAATVVDAAPDYGIRTDPAMDLDHGTWTVLRHLYPRADVPVFQLSIDATQPASYHYQLARDLRTMRDKGLLTIGSGNVVHNLARIDWKNIDAPPQAWALEFDALVHAKLAQRDDQALVQTDQLGSLFTMSHPTTEHYLPMLYTLGVADAREEVDDLYEGIQFGSAGMRCFRVG